MAVLRIFGKQVDVDIENELQQYSWERERWTPGKLIACSPFRSDTSPSFFVNLESGGWADSGAVDEYTSGNLFTLLGHLRGTSPYEACEYLIEKYGVLYEVTEDNPTIQIQTPELNEGSRKSKEIEGEHVIRAVSPYMKSRGISDGVQRQFAVGYGEGHKGFTAIPWYSSDGRLVNVKYRSTSDKRFFYESNATPVNTLVYGIDQAQGHSEVVIVEGEIDALSWWTAGIPAVSLGGAHISDEQAEVIIREGFDSIYLGGDNDKQGRRLNAMASRKLRGTAGIYEVNYGEEKDANDVLKRCGAKHLRELISDATPIQAIQVRLG